MQKYTLLTLVVMGTTSLFNFGCVSRRVQNEEQAATTENATDHSSDTSNESKEQRIENLTSALSRAQSRIEELDAKVSALSDKVESTRLTVDNITGTGKPIKTEAVGSVAAIDKKNLEEESPKTKSTAQVWSKSDAAVGEFGKAMELYKKGKYADAVLGFNHFTETFPENILAGSAQFYAGESYYMMGEFKLALNEYEKVVSSFSSSPRVASAMVRIAHCYESLGNKAESSRTMALARDLFENNPSLDWPNNAQAANPHEKDGGLSTAPIEPKHTDDKEIDKVN